MRSVSAWRYVTPFREGGSMPALVDGDDGGSWVVKFRGAGQGAKALAAEIVSAAIARALDLDVPEVVLVEIDPVLGKSEPDYEIRELLKASAGTNVGLAFLPQAVMFDPAADAPVDATLASRIVAFDAFVMNVDRTPRNPNLLRCRERLWLIDHGASLIFLHSWDGSTARAATPFAGLPTHVLHRRAADLDAAWDHLRARVTDAVLDQAVADVPAGWLDDPPALAAFLKARRDSEAARARRV